MKRKISPSWSLILFLAVYFSWGLTWGEPEAVTVAAKTSSAEIGQGQEHPVGFSIEIKSEAGEIISLVNRAVVPGDEIITAEGRHYRIMEVNGQEAKAKDLGSDRGVSYYQDFFAEFTLPASVQEAAQTKTVGLYHTHSDESYVPTDGTESIKFGGGIYQVGETLAQGLEAGQVKVDYDKTPHDPHDNDAYARSRRTAVQLMTQGPVALIDVHRDGIPDASYYQAQIENQDVARLRLVVGRENPNMDANLDFAKQMMAYANEVHPYIVKEIFLASGNYNQDLMPTALLVEAGTYTNTKEEAAQGISMFSEAVPVVLGVNVSEGGVPEVAAEVPTGGGVWRALGWILGIFVLGGAGYLVIAAGGFKAAWDKLRFFFSREFGGK